MKKNKLSTVHSQLSTKLRSSAAEYLTFVAAVGDTQSSIEMRYEDENIWLTQKMMATLYGVSVPAINQHLKRLFDDNELERRATIKQYLIVQAEGKRNVQRAVDHYNLQAVIAVGFKIENERAVQFRKWANKIVKDYTIQGWTMDEERLKKGGTVLHGQTAAEMITDRADHQKGNMGLESKEIYRFETELTEVRSKMTAINEGNDKMTRKKTPIPAIRSSAAEYLTFVAADGKGLWKHIVGIFVILGILNISIRYSGIRNHRIAGRPKLFDTIKQNIFERGEFLDDSVVKESLITAVDGEQYQTCACLSTYNNPVYGLVLLCTNSITPGG